MKPEKYTSNLRDSSQIMVHGLGNRSANPSSDSALTMIIVAKYSLILLFGHFLFFLVGAPLVCCLYDIGPIRRLRRLHRCWLNGALLKPICLIESALHKMPKIQEGCASI